MARLPPLNALRAFECAARHEGFIGAAEELHVTRGAISRHVKLLEDHLGVQLFVRQAQGVRLTEAGRQLLPVLSDAFRMIARGAERITADASELRVICPPGTSIRWLLPRLDDFRRRYPDFTLRLATDFFPDGGFDTEAADIGFSVSKWPNRAKDVEHLTLFPVFLTPACAPSYLASGSLRRVEDLSRCDLLHESRRHGDWRAWTDAFRPAGLDPTTGQDFPNIDIATKAAVMGVGVVMADLVLCQEELASGTLVAPFPDMVCAAPSGGICLIGARDTWTTPKVEAFKSWAHESAAKDRALVAHLAAVQPGPEAAFRGRETRGSRR